MGIDSEEDGRVDADAAAYLAMLHARGVRHPCMKCTGYGRFNYPNTGTWRATKGALVGHAFTMDVCDDCWGSGDCRRPGVDLRALEAKVRRAELESVLHYRRVRPEDACERCNGMGAHWYSSGATWRGGMGTASCEWDVCAECWGSGDRNKSWTNLRKVDEVIERLRAATSARWFAEKAGLGFSHMRSSLVRLSEVVTRETRRRKVEGVDLFTYYRTAEILAGAIMSLSEAFPNE